MDVLIGMPRVLAFSLALFAAAIGCDRSQEVRHPILDDTGALITDVDSATLDALDALARRIAERERVTTIGTLDGPIATAFGNPTDIVSLPSGEVLILDAMAGEVRVFDANGTYVRTIVRKGGGPTELPDAFVMRLGRTSRTPTEELFVAGPNVLKAFVFRDSTLLPLNVLRSEEIPPLADFCVSGDHLAIRSRYSTGNDLLAMLDMTTGDRQAFGTGYQHGGRLARTTISEGPITCTPEGTVVVAYSYLPTVEAYDREGNELWSVRIPSFAPLTFSESRTMGRGETFTQSYSYPGDRVLALDYVPGGGVLLQVVHLAGSEPGTGATQSYRGITTYLLSARSGRGLAITDSLPQVISITDGQIWVGELAPEGYGRIVALRY